MDDTRFRLTGPGWYPDWPYSYAMNFDDVPGEPEIARFLLVVDWCVERFGEIEDRDYRPSTRHAYEEPIRWYHNARSFIILIRDQQDAIEFKMRWL